MSLRLVPSVTIFPGPTRMRSWWLRRMSHAVDAGRISRSSRSIVVATRCLFNCGRAGALDGKKRKNSPGSSREYGAYTRHHQHRRLGAETRRPQLRLAAPEEGYEKAMLLRLEHGEGIVAKSVQFGGRCAWPCAWLRYSAVSRLTSHTQIEDLSSLHREARVR
jgi:hypothetical protein